MQIHQVCFSVLVQICQFHIRIAGQHSVFSPADRLHNGIPVRFIDPSVPVDVPDQQYARMGAAFFIVKAVQVYETRMDFRRPNIPVHYNILFIRKKPETGSAAFFHFQPVSAWQKPVKQYCMGVRFPSEIFFFLSYYISVSAFQPDRQSNLLRCVDRKYISQYHFRPSFCIGRRIFLIPFFVIRGRNRRFRTRYFCSRHFRTVRRCIVLYCTIGYYSIRRFIIRYSSNSRHSRIAGCRRIARYRVIRRCPRSSSRSVCRSSPRRVFCSVRRSIPRCVFRPGYRSFPRCVFRPGYRSSPRHVFRPGYRSSSRHVFRSVRRSSSRRIFRPGYRSSSRRIFRSVRRSFPRRVFRSTYRSSSRRASCIVRLCVRCRSRHVSVIRYGSDYRIR